MEKSPSVNVPDPVLLLIVVVVVEDTHTQRERENVNVSTAHRERLEKKEISLNKCASSENERREREREKERKRRIKKRYVTKKESREENPKTRHQRLPSVLPGVFFRNGEREAGRFASLLLRGSFAHFFFEAKWKKKRAKETRKI